MLSLFKKTILIILCVSLISTPMNAAASGLLEATSQSINVLALPEPEIDRIDAETNTVYLKQPDIELNDRMDLRAVLVVADDNNVHLQTKDVKVSSTDSIRIALNTKLKKNYNITTKFTNHGIDSGGTSALHSHEPEETPPENPTPEASPPTVIYKKSGGSRVETQYIVKELTPETVEVEKLVEAYQPPIYIKGDEVYINGMPEPEDAEAQPPGAIASEDTSPVKIEPSIRNPVVLVPDGVHQIAADISGIGSLIFVIILFLWIWLLILVALFLLIRHKRIKNATRLRQPRFNEAIACNNPDKDISALAMEVQRLSEQCKRQDAYIRNCEEIWHSSSKYENAG